MYPRNAASPERIAIGAVVQISDGAVQTSGVSIKVKPQGTTASAGGGTTSYEEGIVEYLPTQAETNYTSFEVIAYKTGCIPVAATIVTTTLATEVAAIKAKTDNLPAAPAATGDIPTATQNADAILARDIGSGSGAGTLDERTVRSALRFIRNKWSTSGATLTVTKEDDSTTAWTATVTTSAGADPIVGNDPT